MRQNRFIGGSSWEQNAALYRRCGQFGRAKSDRNKTDKAQPCGPCSVACDRNGHPADFRRLELEGLNSVMLLGTLFFWLVFFSPGAPGGELFVFFFFFELVEI